MAKNPKRSSLFGKWIWYFVNSIKSFLSWNNGAIEFLVFTHVTFVLATVAIPHVGAHTNSNKCACSKVRVRK